MGQNFLLLDFLIFSKIVKIDPFLPIYKTNFFIFNVFGQKILLSWGFYNKNYYFSKITFLESCWVWPLSFCSDFCNFLTIIMAKITRAKLCPENSFAHFLTSRIHLATFPKQTSNLGPQNHKYFRFSNFSSPIIFLLLLKIPLGPNVFSRTFAPLKIFLPTFVFHKLSVKIFLSIHSSVISKFFPEAYLSGKVQWPVCPFSELIFREKWVLGFLEILLKNFLGGEGVRKMNLRKKLPFKLY